MDSMATWQILWRLARGKHVLSAHGTVIFILIFETTMSIKNVYRNAHATLRAMSKVLLTTYAAKTTLVAMKWLFQKAHP